MGTQCFGHRATDAMFFLRRLSPCRIGPHTAQTVNATKPGPARRLLRHAGDVLDNAQETLVSGRRVPPWPIAVFFFLSHFNNYINANERVLQSAIGKSVHPGRAGDGTAACTFCSAALCL